MHICPMKFSKLGYASYVIMLIVADALIWATLASWQHLVPLVEKCVSRFKLTQCLFLKHITIILVIFISELQMMLNVYAAELLC